MGRREKKMNEGGRFICPVADVNKGLEFLWNAVTISNTPDTWCSTARASKMLLVGKLLGSRLFKDVDLYFHRKRSCPLKHRCTLSDVVVALSIKSFKGAM